MKSSKSKKICISIPEQWVEELKRTARLESIKKGIDISYMDIIRRAVKSTIGE